MNKYFSNWIFYCLILIAPFVYFIQYTDYGFFNIPVLLNLFTLIVISTLLSLLEKITGWASRIFIGTLTITFSLSFLSTFKSNTAVFSVFFVVLILHILLDKNIRSILKVMTLAFIISVVIIPGKQQLTKPIEKQYQIKSAYDNKLPPVIHLMLDEFAGVAGFPKTTAQGKHLRRHIEHFFTDNGFHVYANAYSHYTRTFNSVSNMMNFSTNPHNHAYFKEGSTNLTQNKYFKYMAAKGYKIRVYQFDSMMNYCEPNKYPIASCYEYPAASLASIKSLPITAIHKYFFMFKTFLLWSHGYEMVMKAYDDFLRAGVAKLGIQLPQWQWDQARTSTIWVPQLLKRLAYDITQHPSGTLFYAHILGPHTPYIYNAQCQLIKNPMLWDININYGLPLNTAQSRIQRYKLYENQVHCLTLQLNQFFDVLKKAHIYQKAIIIINGDHGSRITRLLPIIKNKDTLTLENYQDSFSALFAIKMPGAEATTSYSIEPIQQLFADVIENITGQDINLRPTKPYGYLMGVGFHSKMQPIYLDSLKSTPTT